jgi:hypothetical protein
LFYLFFHTRKQVPPASWMSGFEAACIAGRLAQSTPQELCMLLQGVAVLRLQPSSSWVGALQDAVLQQLDWLSPRDISQVRVGEREGYCCWGLGAG